MPIPKDPVTEPERPSYPPTETSSNPMSEHPEQGALHRVWNTDAPAGQAWVCPDCDSWATLGGNAGYHVKKTGHKLPTLKPQPHPEHQSKQEITEEELLRTASECSLRAGIGIGKAEKASQHSAPLGETAMQIAEEWFSGRIPRTFPTRRDAVEAMAGIISRHLAKRIGMWDELKPELGPQEPRAETWHKERENWADEVNRLRSSVSKQERDETHPVQKPWSPNIDTQRLDWPTMRGTWHKRIEEYEKFQTVSRDNNNLYDSNRYEGIATATRWCLEDIDKAMASNNSPA